MEAIQVSNETAVKEPAMLDRVIANEPAPRIERHRSCLIAISSWWAMPVHLLPWP